MSEQRIPFLCAQDDTLEYKVYVSKAVPRENVTLTAIVVVLAHSQDNTPETINQRVQEALTDFIPGHWEFLGHERGTISPGFEQIKVQVLTRIIAAENRNLNERARRASREGLEITNIKVKSTLPQDEVNQIIKKLWFETVEKVNEHIVEFNKASGRLWRIGNIVLGVPGGGKERPAVSSKMAYREEPDDLLGVFMESGFSGLEKISLTANVTLKSERPETRENSILDVATQSHDSVSENVDA